MHRALPLLLLASLSCKKPPAPTPRPRPVAPAAPVVEPGGALTAVPGDTATDRQIRETQELCRRNPTRARPWLRLAQVLVRKARESSDPGFYQLADDAVARALRLDPNDLAALQVRGLVLMQDHRFGDGVDGNDNGNAGPNGRSDAAPYRATFPYVQIPLRGDAILVHRQEPLRPM